jgi:hypothetical protein
LTAALAAASDATDSESWRDLDLDLDLDSSELSSEISSELESNSNSASERDRGRDLVLSRSSSSSAAPRRLVHPEHSWLWSWEAAALGLPGAMRRTTEGEAGVAGETKPKPKTEAGIMSSSTSRNAAPEAPEAVVSSVPDRNARSLPYVKPGAGRPPAGRWSSRTSTSTATTTSGLTSPELDDHDAENDRDHDRAADKDKDHDHDHDHATTMVREALSYSVPTPAALALGGAPRNRPAVDVLATYMCDSRTAAKAELLRNRFGSPSGNAPARIRSMSKEGSNEWGFFVDIDSSGESWAGGGADGSLSHLRRKLSSDLGDAAAVHVLGDEQANTRITAAHKAFDVVTDGMSRVVSGTIQIPKFRIVQSRAGTDRHAQYLITFRLGKEMYADWRRYSEFAGLVKKLPPDAFQRTQLAWRNIDTRWFNRLEPSYLHKKCITLENFMRELMYESTDPSILIEFLGGYLGKVNALPIDPDAARPAAQLPKELRPPQPKHERELFEKVWAENFKRSCVDYSTTPTNASASASAKATA